MKTLLKFNIVLILLLGCSNSVFSQFITMDNARASASIVEPVAITKTENSDLGNVAIIITGKIEMVPAGSHKTPANIVLPTAFGSYTAAVYCFSANNEGYAYTVSLPTTPFIVKTGPQFMEVASFTSDPVSDPRSNLIAGVFVSVTPSNITVNYN